MKTLELCRGLNTEMARFFAHLDPHPLPRDFVALAVERRSLFLLPWDPNRCCDLLWPTERGLGLQRPHTLYLLLEASPAAARMSQAGLLGADGPANGRPASRSWVISLATDTRGDPSGPAEPHGWRMIRRCFLQWPGCVFTLSTSPHRFFFKKRLYGGIVGTIKYTI